MKISHLQIRTKKEDKPILQDLNLNLKKGELLAILGPSGSGKTTLLEFMTGNVQKNIRYEGDSEIRGQIKYVSQEDHLHGFYTVRKYLNLYIDLNYGFSLDEGTKDQIIRGVAEECGLTSALDTIVGDLFFKGLSGGQKRRLSIALELVSKPDILILDEPTSGLDSFSAFSIIQLLKNLTNEGITVICTLHQPSSEIWGLLDKILLISKGYNCYLGDTKGAEKFFASMGKIIPQNYNPGDFFISQINSDFDPNLQPQQLNQKFMEWQNQPQDLPDTNRLLAIKPTNLRELIINIKESSNYLTKFLSILSRSLYNLLKNPGILGVRLAMYMILSFMVGVMYYNLGNQFNQQDIVSRTALLFYVDAFLVFMSIAALPFFLIERAIIQKEVNNQLYHPFQYQLSQFIAAIPGVALIALISSLFVVLLADLNGFGVFFVILFLSLLIAESLARLVSLLVPHYIIGMALISGLYGMFMLCEGFLIVHQNIPGYFIWGYWMAFHTYSYEAFMYNEFNTISSFNSPQFASGMDVLNFYDMGTTKVWRDCVILIAFMLLFEVFIFVVMARRFRKNKIAIRRIVPISDEP